MGACLRRSQVEFDWESHPMLHRTGLSIVRAQKQCRLDDARLALQTTSVYRGCCLPDPAIDIILTYASETVLLAVHAGTGKRVWFLRSPLTTADANEWLETSISHSKVIDGQKTDKI